MCLLSPGGKCASAGPVVGPEEGQRRDSVPLGHTHHLCGEQPGDAQGDVGKQQVQHHESQDYNKDLLLRDRVVIVVFLITYCIIFSTVYRIRHVFWICFVSPQT